jgi:membrane protease subunit HflC
MEKKLSWAGLVLGAFAILGYFSVYIVNETQQTLILRFGQSIGAVDKPGLHLKMPFDDVVFYEKRVLDLDPSPERILLSDQKPLIVDTFVRYRIDDPLKFYQSLRTESAAKQRLETLVNSVLRGVMGESTLVAVLSTERVQLMQRISEAVNREAQTRNLGIRIVDIRIRRADLPEQTSQAIYDRMMSERRREAAEFRAEGQEQKQQIESKAERERTILIAEAQRQAQSIRGEGDKEATKIYADAFNRDPDFYSFYRSMLAYRNAMSGPNTTTFVLSPDRGFLRYLNGDKK